MKNVVIITLLSVITTLVAAKEYREYNERSAAELESRSIEYWINRQKKRHIIRDKYSEMILKECAKFNNPQWVYILECRGMTNKPQSIKDILAEERAALNKFETDHTQPAWVKE